MKPISIILAIIVTLSAAGQVPDKYQFRLRNDSVKLKWQVTHTPQTQASKPILTIYENGKAVAYQKQDSSIVVVDSAATIRVFFKSARMQMEAVKSQSEKQNAADEVLQYANADGTVRDKRKFSSAVKKYQTIKKKS
jgi:hypothetical protein